MLMANAHQHAMDYIEQAPVIVLAATHGKQPRTGSERSFIQEQLANLCHGKAKLRDVMHAYGLPLPLRLLDARVLISTRATVIRRLALMNPSTLAQIIPTTRQKQNAWLQALHTWCEQMACHSKGTPFFEWAATKYPGITYGTIREAGHMADFVSALLRLPAHSEFPRASRGRVVSSLGAPALARVFAPGSRTPIRRGARGSQ
jgi:hypothetical protein